MILTIIVGNLVDSSGRFVNSFLGRVNLLFGLGNSNSSGKDFVLGELVMCENSSLGWEYGLVFDY